MTTDGGDDEGGAGERDDARSGDVTRVRKPFDLDTIRAVVHRLLEPERVTSGKAT
jgi:hypothetical protein